MSEEPSSEPAQRRKVNRGTDPPDRARDTTAPAEGPGAMGLAAAAATGMVIFALTAHTGFPLFVLAVSGLLLTALGIALSFRDAPSRTGRFGLGGISGEVGGWIVAGVVLGIALALLLRFTSEQPLLLTGVKPFVFTAVAIGAAEELLFRGFIQGQLASLGPWASVILAALAHTAYKVGLFAFPSPGVDVALSTLGLLTFLVGVLLGIMRVRSNSVLPAVAAHVTFDIFVYGDWSTAPWWVWS